MTIRPSLASRGILDPVRMRRQHRVDRTNIDDVCFRPEIEDLGGESMGDGNDGDFGLLAQIEPQPQGAMGGEVTNKDIRQRTVVFLLVRGTVIRLPFPLLR